MQRWRWEYEEGRRRFFARRRISCLSYEFSDEADLGTRYAVLIQTMMITLVLCLFFSLFITDRDYDSPWQGILVGSPIYLEMGMRVSISTTRVKLYSLGSSKYA